MRASVVRGSQQYHHPPLTRPWAGVGGAGRGGASGPAGGTAGTCTVQPPRCPRESAASARAGALASELPGYGRSRGPCCARPAHAQDASSSIEASPSAHRSRRDQGVASPSGEKRWRLGWRQFETVRRQTATGGPPTLHSGRVLVSGGSCCTAGGGGGPMSRCSLRLLRTRLRLLARYRTPPGPRSRRMSQAASENTHGCCLRQQLGAGGMRGAAGGNQRLLVAQTDSNTELGGR